ncbi:hypothetical protein POM88_054176 [Heracleum sosnowskyi]|uniref:Uncharacterized protein n=1 Tax=Heracleum sosnowskyi TaxID=360622 RepID=A0AAD8LX97_9APIA|nr:hypothetical protein POM88_054176 [Heracleum sosnowskyi]
MNEETKRSWFSEHVVVAGHCTTACDNVELMQERTKGCPVYSLDTCNDDDDFAEPVRIRVGEIQCVENERDRAGVVYEGGKKVNKLKLLRKKCVIDICESAYIVGVGTSSKKRRRDVKVGSSFVGGTRLDVTCKKKLALRKKLSSTSAKCEEKKKKVRTYNRYIQKKFSPSIFSEVIENLSKPQIKWIKDTGFGDLLNFKMQCYPHNLGYNVVEVFDASTCSLVFKGRTIKITEGLVQSTLGFPLGGKCVQFSESEEPYSVWGKQFPGRTSSLISPLMVMHVMSENTEADAIFKWNFLMLMYNFFIESNQNAFLLRDVLRFSGNIDECGEYNWCSLMLDKLKTTQTYWAESPKRNFTGALPLLIYVYVDQVRAEQNKDVVRTEPAYVAWTDALLRERQKYEMKYKCFGIGKIESGAENVEDEETDMMNDADLVNIVNGLSLHDYINSEDNDANTQISNGNMCNANEVLLGDNCEKADDVLPGTNIVRGEGRNDKGIELELGQDMVTVISIDSKITRRQNVASQDSIFTLTATLAEDYATETLALDSKLGNLDSTLCGELLLSPKAHSRDSKLCGKSNCLEKDPCSRYLSQLNPVIASMFKKQACCSIPKLHQVCKTTTEASSTAKQKRINSRARSSLYLLNCLSWK